MLGSLKRHNIDLVLVSNSMCWNIQSFNNLKGVKMKVKMEIPLNKDEKKAYLLLFKMFIFSSLAISLLCLIAR